MNSKETAGETVTEPRVLTLARLLNTLIDHVWNDAKEGKACMSENAWEARGTILREFTTPPSASSTAGAERAALREIIAVLGPKPPSGLSSGAEWEWAKALQVAKSAHATPSAASAAGDKPSGLYRKFEVRRTDGTDAPGGKHDGCDYFVLDMTHDPHAFPAMVAYARSLQQAGTHPDLVQSIVDRWLGLALLEHELPAGKPSAAAGAVDELVAADQEYDAAHRNLWIVEQSDDYAYTNGNAQRALDRIAAAKARRTAALAALTTQREVRDDQ